MDRVRFTVDFAGCAMIAAIPGLLVAYGLNEWITVGIFATGVLLSTMLGAQLAYRGVRKRLLLNKNPWFPCIYGVMVSYVLFGISISAGALALKESIEFGWPSAGAFLLMAAFMSSMAVIFSACLAVPLVVALAFRLKRSNTPLQATQQGRAPEH